MDLTTITSTAIANANTKPLADIAHQLTRIADHLTDTGEIRITCEQAQEAWEKAGMRIYYDAFTSALQNLGIIIT
jgi:hypothetical protein